MTDMELIKYMKENPTRLLFRNLDNKIKFLETLMDKKVMPPFLDANHVTFWYRYDNECNSSILYGSSFSESDYRKIIFYEDMNNTYEIDLL